MKKTNSSLKKQKSVPHSGGTALAAALSDLAKRKPSGVFVMLPFRVFEMLRFPKTKRFFSPQVSDQQIFKLLPERAADQLEDLMALGSPADRLSVFHEMEARSDLAVEVGKKTRVEELVGGHGFKPKAAERLLAAGEDWTMPAVRWLSEVLKSPDKRTRKMLILLLAPSGKKKLNAREIMERLEFTRIPLPQAKKPDELVKIFLTARDALKIGFPFHKRPAPHPHEPGN